MEQIVAKGCFQISSIWSSKQREQATNERGNDSPNNTHQKTKVTPRAEARIGKGRGKEAHREGWAAIGRRAGHRTKSKQIVLNVGIVGEKGQRILK